MARILCLAFLGFLFIRHTGVDIPASSSEPVHFSGGESKNASAVNLSSLKAQLEQQAILLERLDQRLTALSTVPATPKGQRVTYRPQLAYLSDFSRSNGVNPIPPPTSVDDELQGDRRHILGSVETINFSLINRSITARIDTGAETSSLCATEITEFERNGKKWVRFKLYEEGLGKRSQWVMAPVKRRVKIRQPNSGSELQRRYVVSMDISLGPIHQRTEFSLADRTMMAYPVLLGREFIKDVALVDVSKKFSLSRKIMDSPEGMGINDLILTEK